MARLLDPEKVLMYAALFYLILYAAALVSMLAFSAPALAERRHAIERDFARVAERARGEAGWLYIFQHNFVRACLMAIPYVGIIVFAAAAAMTGVVVGAVLAPMPPAAKLLALLSLLMPHGILESIAYGIALHSAADRRSIRHTLMVIPLIAAILLAAAVIEYLSLHGLARLARGLPRP